MNKSLLLMTGFLLLVAGLYFAGFAAATDMACTQENAGKPFCISGELMKCVKIFDPKSKAQKYEWNGVNKDGQAFNLSTALYKKVAGFTPASCTVQKVKSSDR